ncbi:MAG: leucine-rich repeat domain-containing protein [Treponemataceae bacterium]|nr:leucine-rich repeat domain-containing protein [Treponemataceae bacterium]
MKKMMKVAAMLAAVVLAAGMTACQKSAGTAKAAKPTPVNEFSRELTKDASGVRILKYNGSAKSVVIPAEIEGLPVKEISNAFRDNETLKRVTIPDSVQVIYDSAFSGCTALESVTLGNSVQEIGGSAFACTALESVTIPDSVKRIGQYAFYGCTALKSVTLGNSVQIIDYHAFSNCTSLQSLTIPDSLQKIEFPYGSTTYAFEGTELPLATQARLKALGYTSSF